MTTPLYTEGLYPAEFLISEGRGTISRDAAILISGQNLDAGTVLGQIAASGKYTVLAPAASDGSQIAAAVLYAPVDASLADKPCVVVSRYAELDGAQLVWPEGITTLQKTTAIGQLAATGLIVR